MSFDLNNAPPTFQRMMNQGLQELIEKICFAYIDNIVVYETTLEEHNKNVKEVFQRLREVGLRLQLDKCEFLKPELSYLGHVIYEGVNNLIQKTEKIKNYPRPKNPKEVKQFFGLIGYYKKFIKDFAEKAQSLTNLLKESVPWNWENAEESAFQQLKALLYQPPILK